MLLRVFFIAQTHNPSPYCSGILLFAQQMKDIAERRIDIDAGSNLRFKKTLRN